MHIQYENINFWSLLGLCAAASLMPVYPPIPLVWLCVALIWYHRYGPSWYLHNMDTDEDHVYIIDLVICLPLVAVMMIAVLLENIRRKTK
jgi:hypothetical protein